jgi:hypothetical protein
LKRREATQLLREIASSPEAMPLTCVYLKPHKQVRQSSNEDFDLHIKAESHASTRGLIERLARAQRLHVKNGLNGFLIVYSSEEELLEIAA